MKYICVQPRTLYFAWQLEVMIKNFLLNGINSNDIDILVAINPLDETFLSKNINAFNRLEEISRGVNFFYYTDTRESREYIPSIYFNIIKQHFKAFPELNSQSIFCHDCDILFTKPIDFSEMENDNTWYLSNTVDYISSDYILSKGQNIYDNMCKIIGIDKNIPIINKENSGGGQYIIKNATFDFWNKVEKDSILLYSYFEKNEKFYQLKFKGDLPIQKWTAGMWSLLWNAWYFGYKIKVDKRLDFCWATCPIEKWESVSIFHNAGVVREDRGRLFFKGEYVNLSPFNSNFDRIDKKYCSIRYVEAIKKCRELF